MIVDDEYESVRDAVGELLQSGIPVAYWDGSSERELSNVRAVLLDIDLAHLDIQTDDDTLFLAAVEVLRKISGAPLVLISSSLYDDEQPARLRAAYQKVTGKTFPGVISNLGMTKDELSDRETLMGRIKSALEDQQLIRLALLWECVLDNAQDRTVETLFSEQTSSTITTIVKKLEDEWGPNSLGREFTGTMLRMLTRFARNGKFYGELSERLKALASSPLNPSSDPDTSPLSLLMFYLPDELEGMWTGDIYRTNLELAHQYAAVLTPACDFAGEKVERPMVCYGFPISVDGLKSKDHPIYAKDPKLAKIFLNQQLNDQQREEKAVRDAKAKYLDEEEGLHIPERMYVLRHFPSKNPDEQVLCFDFQDVGSVGNSVPKEGKIEGWERIARLDSPYVDVMLQTFGTYMSRLGAPTINHPLHKLREWLK